MFSNYKKIPTSGLDEYSRRLMVQAGSRVEDVSFPCGAELRGGVSLRAVFSQTRNTNEIPATMQCGDMLWGGESVLCRHCYAEYDHQKNGKVESIPLRGSAEDKEAEREVDAAHSENKLVRFAKNHPYLTAGIGLLFAASAIGAALGAYRAYSESSTATSSQPKPTTTKPTTTKPTTTKPTTTKPTTTKPTTTKLTTTEPTTTELTTTKTTQPTTIQLTTVEPTAEQSASTAITESVTTQAANQTTTQTTTQVAPTSFISVNSISVSVDNFRGRKLNARFEVCDPKCAVVKTIDIPSQKAMTVSFNINNNFKSANATYSFLFQEKEPLKNSLNNDIFPNGTVSLATNENINSLDIKQDGKLEVRHSLLNFEGANRLDQVYEDKNGMPQYAGVTTKPMKLRLKNKWYSYAYFSLNAKGANITTEYANVKVWNYKEKSFPTGVHELDVDVTYPPKTFDGKALNKALVDNTVCITSVRYGSLAAPTYLSNLKSSRCK